MRTHSWIAVLGLTMGLSAMAACSSSLCDESWSAERDELIGGALCSGPNKTAVEDELGALEVPAVEGTMIVIDTDTGRIVRVPSDVTGPENSRLEAVSPDVDGAEIIRPAATVANGLDVAEGVGFMTMPQAGGPEQAVFVAEAVTFGPTYVRVIGERPLVLVGSTVVVEGIIDVAAGCAGDPTGPTGMRCAGPGGGDGGEYPDIAAEGCAPGGAGQGGQGDDTGGGGGGFGAPGGAGGTSLADPDDATTMTREGGAGGDPAACPGEALAVLQGGSGGGFGEGDVGAGAGGGGGGALAIIAACEIRVGVQAVEGEDAPVAGVWASGGGGAAGEDTKGVGGGGGGAGGAILLESPLITLNNTVLAANGGSGGSGGLDEDVPDAGTYGPFGAESAPGGGTSHAGGAGGSAAMPAQSGDDHVTVGSEADGTGGGGGAVGRIRINTDTRGLIETDVVASPLLSSGELQ